jgi:hypothetical protein
MEAETELQTSMPTSHTKKSDVDPYVDIEIPLKLNPETGQITEQIELLQNYPNPFSAETTIAFTLPRSMEATITIYNIAGQLVKTIHAQFEKGDNKVSLSDELFSSGGIYYYQLKTADYQNTKRMVFIKG